MLLPQAIDRHNVYTLFSLYGYTVNAKFLPPFQTTLVRKHLDYNTILQVMTVFGIETWGHI